MINAFLFCRKLRELLQQRLIKFFIDQSKKDAKKYAKFFEDYGLFMREGIVTTAEQEVKVGLEGLGFRAFGVCYGLWRNLVGARNLGLPGRDWHSWTLRRGKETQHLLQASRMQQAWYRFPERPDHGLQRRALPGLV